MGKAICYECWGLTRIYRCKAPKCPIHSTDQEKKPELVGYAKMARNAKRRKQASVSSTKSHAAKRTHNGMIHLRKVQDAK